MNKKATHHIVNIKPEAFIVGIISVIYLIMAYPVHASASTPKPAITDLSIEQLMEVEVDSVFGASKFEQKITEAPSSISIITSADIRQYGYRTLGEQFERLEPLKLSSFIP
jgi:outer membrane receptor for ferrienterochelin and colicin